MKNKDFTTTLVVDQTPKQVFTAINNPRDWWSGEFNGSTEKLNDEFTYRYKDFHFSKQRIVEMIPDQKVVWLITESSLNFVEDKQEWTGTKIIFDITEQDNKTQLRFTHEGLAPDMECFESCSKAWSQLVQEGLFSLITKGKKTEIVLG